MSAQTLGQLDCRSYVYVLECANPSGEEHDHWYVGVASPGHLSTRLDQHWAVYCHQELHAKLGVASSE